MQYRLPIRLQNRQGRLKLSPYKLKDILHQAVEKGGITYYHFNSTQVRLEAVNLHTEKGLFQALGIEFGSAFFAEKSSTGDDTKTTADRRLLTIRQLTKKRRTSLILTVCQRTLWHRPTTRSL